MKLKLTTAVFAALIGLSTAVAAHNAPTVETPADKLYTTVSGIVTVADFGYDEIWLKDKVPYSPLQISMSVKDSEGKVLYKNQMGMTSGDGGATYSYSANILLSAEEGTYNLKLTTPYGTIYDGDMEYTDNTVEKLQAAEDAANLKTELEKNARYMSIDLSIYNAYSEEEKTAVCAELFAKKSEFTTKTSVSEAVSEGVFNVGLKSSSITAEEKETMLVGRLTKPANANVYDAVAAFIEEHNLAVPVIDSFDSAKGSVEEQILFLSVKAYIENCIENVYDLELLIKDNIFGIPQAATDRYASCSDKTTFFTLLNGKVQSINSLDEFYTAINNALTEAVSIPSIPSGGGMGGRPSGGNVTTLGGGGGGGGGAIYKSDNKPTVNNKAENEKEEVTNPTIQGGKFSDMGNYTWANEAVSYLVNENVINGDGKGNFMPSRYITRAEYAKIVAGAFGLVRNSETTTAAFTDVKSGDWYYEAVMACFENEVINGISENLFGADSHITRQDAVVMLNRILKAERNNTAPEQFTDHDEIAGYAKESIYTAKEAGLINGYEDNTVRPKAMLTRAEAAKIIYEAIQYDGGVQIDEK